MGQQKYKIYINGTPVFLTTPDLAKEIGLQADKTHFVGYYSGKKKMIKQYLDLLDKNKSVQSVLLYSNDLDALWADFQACFTLIEAAGGMVRNDAQELLVFYRRGSWDMPKGKIDPGETPEAAALREVQEETGLQHLTLQGFLTHTWHTYEQKGKRILKKTWWYRMHSQDLTLVPQVEEDIETAEWVSPQPWLASNPTLYGSIRDVILMGLQD